MLAEKEIEVENISETKLIIMKRAQLCEMYQHSATWKFSSSKSDGGDQDKHGH